MVAAFRGRAGRMIDPICHDPWADALAGTDGERLADTYGAHNPHATLWMAVRTAFLDNLVRNWDGPQVVILGAGLDTRAARLAREGLRFFEVDHPATQRGKRTGLSALGDYPVDAAQYAGCEFETDDPIACLVSAGLNPELPTLVLWEGVVHYLSDSAIRATSRRISGGLHNRSVLVFDVVSKALVKRQSNRAMDEALSQLVENVGEPLRFGLDDAVPLMHDCGFGHVRTVSFDEACLSLTGTYDRSRAFRFQRFVLGSVARPFSP
jgi:methyltransferase (TIGR00027 family)